MMQDRGDTVEEKSLSGKKREIQCRVESLVLDQRTNFTAKGGKAEHVVSDRLSVGW